MRRPSKEQFSGCLIGQCLGDSLGFLREGFPREDCESYVAGPMQAWYKGKLGDDAATGQYTDDSQLARELMQSYAACGCFDPADYAQRIMAIFVEDRIVGRGIATHQAAMRLSEGIPWEEAGTPSPSAGNGSAMRAAPCGLFFDDPNRVMVVAHDQGRITHLDLRCSAGAVSVAGAVYLAARSEAIDTSAFVAQLAEWVATFDEGFAESVQRLPLFLDLTLDEAVDEIAGLGMEPGETSDWDRISPFVLPSVVWSLYSFLRTPEDYWTAIGTAIRVGGDVDTTAAITGAISGAHLGLDGLPSHLAQRVCDRKTWGYQELVALAERCFELSGGESVG